MRVFNEEKNTIQWFQDFLDNREDPYKKPEFDVIADMGLSFTEGKINHFKAIFDRDKSKKQSLELEF